MFGQRIPCVPSESCGAELASDGWLTTRVMRVSGACDVGLGEGEVDAQPIDAESAEVMDEVVSAAAELHDESRLPSLDERDHVLTVGGRAIRRTGVRCDPDMLIPMILLPDPSPPSPAPTLARRLLVCRECNA